MLQNTRGKKIHANIGNRGLTDRRVAKILDYLKDEVDHWCREYPGTEFGVQRLFGSDWTGTPIQVLYTNRCKWNSSDPVLAAGIDCGLLLRRMLQEDERTFRQTSKIRPGQHYKLVTNKRRK